MDIILRKPTKTYKMDAATKIALANQPKSKRGIMRAVLIDAQLTSEVVIKSRAERDNASQK
jgi:hypothetical protein